MSFARVEGCLKSGARDGEWLQVAEQREEHTLFLWVVFGYFFKHLFKILAASHVKIAAFPSSCRGSHVLTGRGRDCKGEKKEMNMKNYGRRNVSTSSLLCRALRFVFFLSPKSEYKD